MSIFRKSIKRAFLYRRVPEQHVVIIEKDGLIKRLAGPGEVRINHLWESYGDLVKIGPQPGVELLLEEVRSVDGDPFKVRASATYKFDPRYFDFQQSPYLIRQAPTIQESILRTVGAQTIRDVVGQLPSASLRLGSTPKEIEFEVRRLLRSQVRFAGVVLSKVIINRIEAPPEWEAAIRAAREKMVVLEAESHQRRLIAEVAAAEEKTRADAAAYATQRLGEASTREKEILYRLLAEIGLDLAKQITNAEALGTLAANGGSLNLVSPVSTPLGLTLSALLGQPTVVNGNGHYNGKES